MKRNVWIAFSLFLALSLILAGCGQKITAEEIVAKVRETMDSTQDAHAVVTASVDAQGIKLSAQAELWEKMANKARVQVIDSSEPKYVGTTMVTDGQQAWLYEPDRNLVTVGSLSEVEMPLPQELLTSLQTVIQQVLDASNVELVGEEVVSGRDAYKLTLSPKEDSGQELFPGNGTTTLWVDKEQWFVLKATYEADAFGQGSMEVQSFELNPGLADDLFTFEAPEGAKVIDIAAQQPEPMTLVEATQYPGFHVLIPEYVPEGATLINIFKSGESIILRYDHATQVSFAVVQGPELASQPPLGESQNIDIRGQSATVITDKAGGNTFLYWTENGVTVTIAGHIDLDEALKVAESLK
jgi:outer membrane lipoprotein-sorting protein